MKYKNQAVEDRLTLENELIYPQFWPVLFLLLNLFLI